MRKFIMYATMIVAVLVPIIIAVTLLSSCNMQMMDTTYYFDRAIVALPNGEVVEGELESWADYENSDQVQVKINGKTYYTHHSNVVFISE